jgi:hypothetical protein
MLSHQTKMAWPVLGSHQMSKKRTDEFHGTGSLSTVVLYRRCRQVQKDYYQAGQDPGHGND